LFGASWKWAAGSPPISEVSLHLFDATAQCCRTQSDKMGAPDFEVATLAELPALLGVP